MIISIIWACTISCGVLLFKKSAGTLNPCKTNVISLCFYFIIVQTVLGALLTSLGYTKHYTYMRLIDPDKYAHMGIVYAMLTIVLFPMISFLLLKIFRVNPNQEYNQYLNKTTLVEYSRRYYVIVLSATVFCTVLLIVLLHKIGYVPVIELLTNKKMDFSMERAQNVALIIMSCEQIKNIGILYGIPVLSFVSFSFSLATQERKWTVLFFFLFLESIIVKTYDFSKAPLILYIAILVLILIYSKGKINYKLAAIIGGSGIGLLVVAYRLLGYSKSFFDIYNGILGRTIFTQFGTLCMHLEGFSKYIDFLHGRSLYPNVLKLIGRDPNLHIRSSQIIMDLYNPEGVYNGNAGVMNTLFVGEAYANWGHIGAIFSIIWVSIIITVTFILFLKLKKTPITIAFFAVITQQMACCIQGGFVDFVYNSNIIMTILLLFILYFMPKMWKKAERI